MVLGAKSIWLLLLLERVPSSWERLTAWELPVQIQRSLPWSHCSLRCWQQGAGSWLSHHLERRTGHQVLDLLAHQNLRQFVMRYVLGRQSLNSYFTNSKKFNCWDAQGFFCFANISSIHRSSAFASCLKDSISDGESSAAVWEGLGWPPTFSLAVSFSVLESVIKEWV